MAAYNDAVEVMNNADATQETVAAKKEALDAAIKALGEPKVPTVEDQTGSAVLVESKKVVLKWTKVPKAAKYKVVDAENGIEEIVSDTTLTLENLKPGTTYNFKVYALNSADAASEKAIEISNVATMGDGSTKGEIESVTKTPVSDDSVKLTWTLKEGSSFANYDVYVNGELKGNTKAPEFTLKGLEEGTCVVKIVAKTAAGQSALPKQFSFEMKKSVKVLSVTNPEGISVEEGTTFKELKLPNKVTVTVTGNLNEEVEVTWAKDNYQTTPGTYTLEGTLTMGENMKNPDDVKASIKVTVTKKAEEPKPEKDADYTAVNAAIEKANKIDRSKYTEESLKALDDAVAAVEKGLKESKQDKVDAMAEAINKAYAALVEKPAVEEEADYTAVSAAMEKAKKIDRSKYTEESLKALDDAIAAVEKGLKESEQSKVDAMAEAINKAYAELIEKPATDNDKKDDSKKDDSKKDDSKKDDSKKDDSKKNNSDKKSGAVKTGDATPLILWGTATILAAGASVTVILRRRKRR